jgi:glycosyltransferase involved in cell wall biosynthesis
MSAPLTGEALDVLVVSLASTTGLCIADEQLAESLRRAGASVAMTVADRPLEVRTLMLTDLAWARAARTAARRGIAEYSPRSVIYSTTTAALLWPRPGAIRFDAPAAGNRPGRHGLWQRPLERRRLEHSPLLLPLSAGGLAEARLGSDAQARALVTPLPVEPSGPHESVRDITAITYAGNPRKKGLDRVLGAWRKVRSAAGEGAELLVAGATPAELAHAGIELADEPGIRDVGRLAEADYRALLRRARVFICAPRREDYGQAQMEALSDGCLLATTPAPGPYAALGIARRLDAGLVSDDLAVALGHALAHPDPAGYASRALTELEPLRSESLDELIASELLPRLLSSAP